MASCLAQRLVTVLVSATRWKKKEYGRCKQRRLHFSFLVPAAKLPSGLPAAPSIRVKASELIVFSWFSDVLEKFS